MLNSSKAIISGLFFILVTFYLQAADIEKIDPPYWFDCFENDTLMLLLYGENLENLQFKSCSRELKFLSLKPGEHGKNARLFLKIRKSGISKLVFQSSGTSIKLNYEIKNTIKYNPQEINSSDVMYLLMPDRFADGDTNNNIIPENPDNVDKEHLWGRHGGDLSGVMSKLDYLKELGITSLWMTPVYDNAYQFAYHGYTPSNLFTVDPHFGNIKLYKTLIDTLHKSGISIIQDHIVNHISPSHPIALYPPDSLWLNGNLNNFHNCDYRI
ncbi:MAG: cyclomaltodextrinase N-terminal domain-containing protein, partial [Candidatus Marinimicrobia bacterium]|nr:cyclomaltodextrinase N-terminal domain-containing protein [Candidatus Neomarinimicrobiota bacterium]